MSLEKSVIKTRHFLRDMLEKKRSYTGMEKTTQSGTLNNNGDL